MYLTRVQIRNIRSIEELEWSIEPREAPGWHVLVGDNGSGKSTFLRAVAMALAEASASGAWDVLRQSEDDWLRQGAAFGTVDVHMIAGHGAPNPAHVHFLLTGEGARPQVIGALDERAFYAAYGPFRRFSGGSEEYKSLLDRRPRVARCLSVFVEGVALSASLEWLKELRFKGFESAAEDALLERVTAFINSGGLLPQGVQLEHVSSKDVTFKDTGGIGVPVLALSDGYRSMLSLTLELLRQLTATFEVDQVFSPDEPARVKSEGVVLIDEIDAHLHPTWQRRVGLLLRQHFPKMQFIVTSHSPLVCQAADVGSVFLLPRPGSGEEARRIVGTELERLVNGSVLDAYGTEVFGRGVERSDASRQSLDRLAALNVRERRGSLTAQERDEQQRLRAALPSEAYDTRRAS